MDHELYGCGDVSSMMLSKFLEGTLEGDELDDVKEHLKECSDCSLVIRLAREMKFAEDEPDNSHLDIKKEKGAR